MRVGVRDCSGIRLIHRENRRRGTPTPNPSPQGGGEHDSGHCAVRLIYNSPALKGREAQEHETRLLGNRLRKPQSFAALGASVTSSPSSASEHRIWQLSREFGRTSPTLSSMSSSSSLGAPTTSSQSPST